MSVSIEGTALFPCSTAQELTAWEPVIVVSSLATGQCGSIPTGGANIKDFTPGLARGLTAVASA